MDATSTIFPLKQWNTDMSRNATKYEGFSTNDFSDLIEFRCEFENCLWVDWNTTLHKRKASPMQYTSLRSFVKYMNEYGIPSMVATGCLFNLIAFCVFLTNFTYRKSSSSIYLTSLAVANKGYLVALMIVWLGYNNVRIFHKSGWCQLVLYATFLSSFMSAWSMVALSWERYKLVVTPLRSRILCTRNRSKKIITSLIMFALMAYSYVLWTTGILYLGGIPSCAPFSKYFTLLRIMTGIDLFLVIILPSLLIAFFNINTICHMWKKKEQLKKLNLYNTTVGYVVRKQDCTNETTEHLNTNEDEIMEPTFECSSTVIMPTTGRRYPHADERDNSFKYINQENNNTQTSELTMPTIVLTSVCLVLNLPSHSMKIFIYLAKFTGSRHLPLRSAIIQEIFQYMYYINFSVSFVVIFITSPYFRKALGKMLLTAMDKLRSILLSAQ